MTMDLRRDKVVVVDVEATCWRGRAPAGQQSEIIEIGICLLDMETYQPSTGHSILVRPEHSLISPFCTRLTGLTQEQLLAEGISFAEALERMRRDYLTDQRVWASWGDYDRHMFERQCAQRGLPYPFSEQHVNVKVLFRTLNRLRRGIGVEQALEHIDQTFEGRPHRGRDDAYNIARLLAHLLAQHGPDVLRLAWEKRIS